MTSYWQAYLQKIRRARRTAPAPIRVFAQSRAYSQPTKAIAIATDGLLFSGHRISAIWICSSNRRVSRDFTTPSLVKKLSEFLGLTIFHRHFVLAFACILWLLMHLLYQKSVAGSRPYVWTDEAPAIFTKAKVSLIPLTFLSPLVHTRCSDTSCYRSVYNSFQRGALAADYGKLVHGFNIRLSQDLSLHCRIKTFHESTNSEQCFDSYHRVKVFLALTALG